MAEGNGTMASSSTATSGRKALRVPTAQVPGSGQTRRGGAVGAAGANAQNPTGRNFSPESREVLCVQARKMHCGPIRGSKLCPPPPPRALQDVQPVACKGMWAKSSSAWSREEWPGCDSVTRRLGKATPRLGPAVTVELKGRAGSQTRGRLFLFKKLA